jgi:hypothetical protein
METDFGIERPRIPKLTGPNYRPWSLQVKRLLQSMELWVVVTTGPLSTTMTTSTSPESPKPEGDDASRSDLKDAKAATVIMGVCSQPVLQHILLLESAKEQWDTLKKLYLPTGTQQLSTKLQAFAGYRPTDGTTVSEIATALTTLQYEIGSIDPKEKPTDGMKIGLLFQALRALNTQYGPLLLQLELSGANKEWETVLSHVTEFERQLKLSGTTATEKALKAEAKGTKNNTKNSWKKDAKCYNCGEKGHIKKDCTKPAKDKESKDGSNTSKSKGNTEKSEKSASTGPLPTPGGNKGLSPPHTANKSTTEQVWLATEQCYESTTGPTRGSTLSWMIDSGCSRHMTFCKEAFTEYFRLQDPVVINTATGAQLQGVAEGSVTLQINVEGQSRTILLTGVLHVPGLTGSLISVLQLQDRGISVSTEKSPDTGLVITKNQKMIGVAARVGRAYILTTHITETTYKAVEVDPELLHRRLGHLTYSSLQGIDEVTTGLPGPVGPMEGHCSACILSKAVKIINRAQPERTTVPLGRVWMDWWGPFPIPSLDGHTNMLTITDEATRRTWTLFGARRDLFRLFTEWKNGIELESGYKVKIGRSDNGPEFRALAGLLQPGGVKWEFTSFYFQEQNGVPERLNRTLITLARAMLLASKLPLKFWADAATTVCYIRNRTPVGPEGKTPIEAFTGKKPSIAHLRVFGCLAYARVPKESRENKLVPTAVQCVFIGYKATARQYRLYDPRKGAVIEATAPDFHEDKLLQWDWGIDSAVPGDLVVPWKPWKPEQVPIFIGTRDPEITGSDQEDTITVDTGDIAPDATGSNSAETPENLANKRGDHSPQSAEDPIRDPEGRHENDSESDQSENEPGPVKRRGRGPNKPHVTDFNQGASGSRISKRLQQARDPPIDQEEAQYAELYSDPFEPENAFAAIEGSVLVPKSTKEALSDPIYHADWKEAIDVEIRKLQSLDTWTVVDLPPGQKTVGSRLVFAVKYTPTGLVDRFKARFVAQGYSQRPGEDFMETFSPTIRVESLRVLLAIGAVEDLEIRQCDVVSAYPRSKLHAEIYIRLTPELRAFFGITDPNKVLRLNQALYGLKQSGREWYIEACRGLKTLGFEPLFSEPSIFRNAENGQLLGLYVDDIIVLGKDLRAVQRTIDAIGTLWEVKDLGNIEIILGLRVSRDRRHRTLYIDQSSYIKSVLEKFGLQEASPITLPAQDRNALGKALPGEISADQALYQSGIGSLGWISRCSRYDITYMTNQLASYCNEPTIRHWNAAVRILRYLKGSLDYRLRLGHDGTYGLRLQGFCDADYAGDIDTRTSCSGGIWLLGGGPVVWISTKQRSVALSTGESEYISAAEAAKIGQWLRGLLRELQRPAYLGKHLEVPIYSDNTACIALTRDPIAHARTKHIEVRYHYIRQLVAHGKTTLAYLPTADMLADILTKPLPIIAFRRCIQGYLVSMDPNA